MPSSQHSELEYTAEDFLMPEQRLDLLADLLGQIALRVVKQNHEQNRHEQDQTLPTALD